MVDCDLNIERSNGVTFTTALTLAVADCWANLQSRLLDKLQSGFTQNFAKPKTFGTTRTSKPFISLANCCAVLCMGPKKEIFETTWKAEHNCDFKKRLLKKKTRNLNPKKPARNKEERSVKNTGQYHVINTYQILRGASHHCLFYFIGWLVDGEKQVSIDISK